MACTCIPSTHAQRFVTFDTVETHTHICTMQMAMYIAMWMCSHMIYPDKWFEWILSPNRLMATSCIYACLYLCMCVNNFMSSNDRSTKQPIIWLKNLLYPKRKFSPCFMSHQICRLFIEGYSQKYGHKFMGTVTPGSALVLFSFTQVNDNVCVSVCVYKYIFCVELISCTQKWMVWV